MHEGSKLKNLQITKWKCTQFFTRGYTI